MVGCREETQIPVCYPLCFIRTKLCDESFIHRFWDWTREPTGNTYLPDFFEDSEILIESFTGGTRLVKNSLHTYHIPSELRKQTSWPRDSPPSFFTVSFKLDRFYLKDGSTSSRQSWNRTYRWPEDRAIDPREDYNALNK